MGTAAAKKVIEDQVAAKVVGSSAPVCTEADVRSIANTAMNVSDTVDRLKSAGLKDGQFTVGMSKIDGLNRVKINVRMPGVSEIVVFGPARNSPTTSTLVQSVATSSVIGCPYGG